MKIRLIISLTLADGITLCGLVLALLANYATLHNFHWLTLCLLYLSMLADALDGKIARYYANERPFGRYLDGFADLIIYLITPSLFLYQNNYNGGWLLFIILMIICGCLRLSFFNSTGNIEYKKRIAYKGMPVFWSIFIISGWKLTSYILPDFINAIILSVILTGFSIAMIIDRPFFKFSSLKVIITLCIIGSFFFGALHFG